MDLGIVPPEKRKSVRECLRVGQRQVNWPVGGIIFGGFAILFILGYLIKSENLKIDIPPIIGWLLVPLGIAIISSPIWIAWLWWSIAVPKWRIWALRNVTEWPALESAAVTGGLIWPRGHFFEKTEMKSTSERELEAALLLVRDEA